MLIGHIHRRFVTGINQHFVVFLPLSHEWNLTGSHHAPKYLCIDMLVTYEYVAYIKEYTTKSIRITGRKQYMLSLFVKYTFAMISMERNAGIVWYQCACGVCMMCKHNILLSIYARLNKIHSVLSNSNAIRGWVYMSISIVPLYVTYTLREKI